MGIRLYVGQRVNHDIDNLHIRRIDGQGQEHLDFAAQCVAIFFDDNLHPDFVEDGDPDILPIGCWDPDCVVLGVKLDFLLEGD